MTGEGRRRLPLLHVAAVAWTVLAVAWAVTNAAFAAPDETQHFLRAVALAGGEVIGEPVTDYTSPNLDERQLAWVRQATRRVDVPVGLDPGPYTCFIRVVDDSAACIDEVEPTGVPTSHVTAVGNYPPLTYLLPGLAARAAPEPGIANGAARLVGVAMAMGLVLWAARLWRRARGDLVVVALAVVLAPAVLFTFATLNPSGLEIAAAIAVCCAALAIRAGDERRAPLLLLAVATPVLALSRSIGPVWVAVIGFIALVTVTPRGVLRLRAAHPVLLPVVAGVSVVAVGVQVGWERAYGSRAAFGPLPGRGARDEWLNILDVIGRQAIATFGYIDVPSHSMAYRLWWAVGITLLAAGVWATRRWQRPWLLALIGLGLASPLLLDLFILRSNGFLAQGRHVTPILVVAPLFAGDALVQRLTPWFDSRPRWADPAASVVLVLLGLAHALAWYSNARRNAVGLLGPFGFLGVAEWEPPGGWWFWLFVVGAACAALSGVWTWVGLLRDRQPAPVSAATSAAHHPGG